MPWKYGQDIGELRLEIQRLDREVSAFKLANLNRDDAGANAFAARRGALPYQNPWNFVLRWAEGAEMALKLLEER